MSNTKKLRHGKKARRCPMCKSAQLQVKSYRDGQLYTCMKCRFPFRDGTTKAEPEKRKTISEIMQGVRS